jgi:hypothetical protein
MRFVQTWQSELGEFTLEIEAKTVDEIRELIELAQTEKFVKVNVRKLKSELHNLKTLSSIRHKEEEQ